MRCQGKKVGLNLATLRLYHSTEGTCVTPPHLCGFSTLVSYLFFKAQCNCLVERMTIVTFETYEEERMIFLILEASPGRCESLG